MLKKNSWNTGIISFQEFFLPPLALYGARFSHTNLTCKIISFLINLIKLKIIFNQTFFRETDFNGKKRWSLLVKCVTVSRGFHLTCDENCNNNTVDGNNTSHDHRNDRFHNQFWPHYRHGCDSGSGFGCSVCGAHSAEHLKSNFFFVKIKYFWLVIKKQNFVKLILWKKNLVDDRSEMKIIITFLSIRFFTK